MRDFLRFERRELLVFGFCALLYVLIWLAWTVLPLAGAKVSPTSIRRSAGCRWSAIYRSRVSASW